jgi:hypothetical protein
MVNRTLRLYDRSAWLWLWPLVLAVCLGLSPAISAQTLPVARLVVKQTATQSLTLITPSVRDKKRRWRWACASPLLLLVLLLPAGSRAQTIHVVAASGSTVDSSHPAYINPNGPYSDDWPDPFLQVQFTNLSGNSEISFYITMYWFDYDNSSGDSTCDPGSEYYETCFTTQTYTIYLTNCTWYYYDVYGSGWGLASDESEGGYATLEWTVNGANETPYSFDIEGDQDPTVSENKTTVDDFYKNTLSGTPWFWGNILDWESTGGRQYAAAPGYPLVVGDPDGIGISQVDGYENPSYVNDYVYWNFEGNIEQGLAILNAKEPESYSDWKNQYNASAGNAPSDQSYSHCSAFQYVLTAGLDDHSFGDADWIQDYNTHSGEPVSSGALYYLWWDASHGKWDFRWQNSSMAGYNYVPHVCNSASY